MGIWPLQNVVLWRAPYERVYISQRASSGYCVWVVAIMILWLVPIFTAYSAGNLWIKEDFYREQPLVRFLHKYVIALDGDTQSRFFSTDAKLNDMNQKNLKAPMIRYAEVDADTDGLNRGLNENWNKWALRKARLNRDKKGFCDIFGRTFLLFD